MVLKKCSDLIEFHVEQQNEKQIDLSKKEYQKVIVVVKRMEFFIKELDFRPEVVVKKKDSPASNLDSTASPEDV